MFRLPIILLAVALVGALPSRTFAQSLPQPEGYDTLTEAQPASVRPYGFSILGVKPGMPIDEAVALIEEHLGQELSPVEGTLQVENSAGKVFRTKLRVGYVTPGIDFFLRNQSNKPYDSIQIDVSSPAIGSVVTAIRREVRVAAGDGPDKAALLAQLEGLYGKPSDLPDRGDRMWRWALDRAYEPIPMPEPYDMYSYEACAHSLPTEGRFDYRIAPALGEGRKCGMSYVAEYWTKGTETITMTFRLIDYNLMVQDRSAVGPQIDGTLNTATQPADMKL